MFGHHDARTLFNTVIGKHASTCTHLRKRASIVENANFESPIVKIPNCKEPTLQGRKKVTLNLQANIQLWNHETMKVASVVLQVGLWNGIVLKMVCNLERNYAIHWSTVHFSSFEFLWTSVFSFQICLRDRRMAALPGNLESQMFLYVNSPPWLFYVHELTKKIKENWFSMPWIVRPPLTNYCLKSFWRWKWCFFAVNSIK